MSTRYPARYKPSYSSGIYGAYTVTDKSEIPIIMTNKNRSIMAITPGPVFKIPVIMNNFSSHNILPVSYNTSNVAVLPIINVNKIVQMIRRHNKLSTAIDELSQQLPFSSITNDIVAKNMITDLIKDDTSTHLQNDVDDNEYQTSLGDIDDFIASFSPTTLQKLSSFPDTKTLKKSDDDNKYSDDQSKGSYFGGIRINTSRTARHTAQESLPPTHGACISYHKLDDMNTPHAELEEYTICEFSDRPKCFAEPIKDYGGLVLYQYDGETEWNLNGIHCKTGLVLLKESSDLVKSSVGQIHGGIYKTFFNESVNTKIVASGFAYYNKKWVFKSRAFNLEGNAHIMRDSEIQCLKKALQNWCDNGIKTTKVSPVLNVWVQEKGPYQPKK